MSLSGTHLLKVSSNQAAVRKTNDSCTVSKWSVTKSGYYDDHILDCFVEAKSKPRASLINRCYYIRRICIDLVFSHILSFLKDEVSHSKIQVINLGAGFDNTFWRILSKYPEFRLRFVEIDFPEVCRRKCALAKSAGHIYNETVLDEKDEFQLEFSLGDGQNFISIGCNMLDRDRLKVIMSKVLDKAIPTVVLSEVVFVYMRMEERLAALHSVFSSVVNEKFLLFLVYEQLADAQQNAFCAKMLNSFMQQQSPLLSYFKSFKDIACFWDNNFASSVTNVYSCAEITYEEKSKLERKVLRQTELNFDEYEPFHLKAAIYYISLTCFGELNRQFANYMERKFICQFPTFQSSPVRSVNVHIYKTSIPCTFYAAGSCYVDAIGFLLTGGFGNSALTGPAIHSRIKSIRKINFESNVLSHLLLTNESVELCERMYCTSTSITENAVFIFGGRKSPKCPLLSYGIVKLKNDEVNCSNLFHLESSNPKLPLPRYRHCATTLYFRSHKYVLVSGGRFVDESSEVLDDLWLFDVVSFKWKNFDSKYLSARHSHAVVALNESSVAIYGGLNSEELPLSDLFVLKFGENFEVEKSSIETCSKLEPRYGHSMHVMNERLIIIGGVCPLANPLNCAEIVIVNISTGVVQNYMQTSSPNPFMFINHSTFIENAENVEEANLIVAGGGANCFSFGTHFNDKCLKIPLKILIN